MAEGTGISSVVLGALNAGFGVRGSGAPHFILMEKAGGLHEAQLSVQPSAHLSLLTGLALGSPGAAWNWNWVWLHL